MVADALAAVATTIRDMQAPITVSAPSPASVAGGTGSSLPFPECGDNSGDVSAGCIDAMRHPR